MYKYDGGSSMHSTHAQQAQTAGGGGGADNQQVQHEHIEIKSILDGLTNEMDKASRQCSGMGGLAVGWTD